MEGHPQGEILQGDSRPRDHELPRPLRPSRADDRGLHGADDRPLSGCGHVVHITRDTWNGHDAIDIKTQMLTRLLTLVAVMVMIAAGWAFLVTLVSPPLTLGWRETLEATVRRSARYVAVLGIAGVVVLLILALAARPWLVRLLGARHTPARTQSRS